CRESGMILFSLLVKKLNSWRSWRLPFGNPLRVYGGSSFISILCNAAKDFNPWRFLTVVRNSKQLTVNS
ncbi:hypothetical protein CEN41_18755, partial [Fischerella thermalis CCMEE 5330]